MVTKEIDIIKTQSRELTTEQKVELIEFLTRSLRNGSGGSQQLKFGKYRATGKRKSSAEDFLLAEWHPSDSRLNGD